jgi:hypothetical protein
VKPLDGCPADGSASDERDGYLEMRFHDGLPDYLSASLLASRGREPRRLYLAGSTIETGH